MTAVSRRTAQRRDAASSRTRAGVPAYRGFPPTSRDRETRAAISSLSGTIDTGAAAAAWDAARRAPAWHGPHVWTHGDLIQSNLLTRRGRLSAVLPIARAARDAVTARDGRPELSRVRHAARLLRRACGADEPGAVLRQADAV